MKNRIVQGSLFTKWQAVALSPELKWFFQGLQGEADDKNGNVCIDPAWLNEHIGVKADQTTADFETWITKLVEIGWIESYKAMGTELAHAHITGWSTKFSFSYQSIKNPADWAFPTETEPGKSANHLRSETQKQKTSETNKENQDAEIRVPDQPPHRSGVAEGSRGLRSQSDSRPDREVRPPRKIGGVLHARGEASSHTPEEAPARRVGGLHRDVQALSRPKLEKDPSFKAPRKRVRLTKMASPNPPRAKGYRGGQIGSEGVALLLAETKKNNRPKVTEAAPFAGWSQELASQRQNKQERFAGWMAKINAAKDQDEFYEVAVEARKDMPEMAKFKGMVEGRMTYEKWNG